NQDILGAEAHGAAEAFDLFLLGEFADDGEGCGETFGVELGGGSAGEAADVAGELDDGDLEAEADAEVWDGVFAAEAGAGDLALDAALSEATGDDDGVHGVF